MLLVGVRRYILCISRELSSTVTEDGLGVKIVLNRDEDEANHDDECGHLIIKYK